MLVSLNDNAENQLDLTSWATVFNEGTGLAYATQCQVAVKIGDGGSGDELTGNGGSYSMRITVDDNWVIQPNPQIIVFGTDQNAYQFSVVFPVPASANVKVELLSPDVDDDAVDTDCVLYDVLGMVDTIADRLTAARAGYLDNLSALPAAIAAINAIAAAIQAKTDNLLGMVDTIADRLTAARAGYLDNLSAGAVATAAVLATVLEDTGTTLPATLASILEDTGTTLPATLAALGNYIDTEVASILEDTGTTLPAAIAAINAIAAAIQAKTDNLPASPASTSDVLVTVSPLHSTVSAGGVSHGQLKGYTAAKLGAWIWTLTDDDDEDVIVTGHDLRLVIWDPDDATTTLFELSTGASEITISDGNTVTVAALSDAKTPTTAGPYGVALWDATDDKPLATATLTIDAIAPYSS